MSYIAGMFLMNMEEEVLYISIIVQKKKRKLKVTHKDARHVFWKTGVKNKTRSTVHSQVTDLNQTLAW